MSAAARIRQLRLGGDRPLTQKQLAEKLGVDPITISRWERGATSPSDIHRVLLARLGGGHPNDFLDDEEAA